MRFTAHDQQGKSRTLVQLLAANGHTVTDTDPDVLLIDHSGPEYYEKIARHFSKAKIILYSHGARSCIAWDGIWKLNKRVVGYLAFSEGEKLVMQAYNFPAPIEVVGWHWGEIQPMQYRVPRRVLFAPVHHSSYGWIRPEWQKANKLAGELLEKMPAGVTARVYGQIPNYIQAKSFIGIQLADGNVHSALYAIDNCDVVVTYPGTFAYLALARGKPTVMYGQDIPPADHVDGKTVEADNHKKYEKLWQYPLELFDGQAWGVVQQAGSGYAQGIEQWRDLHIGAPITAHRLETAIQKLLGEKDNGSKKDDENGS